MQEAFKFYKNKSKPPDLSRVIDCDFDRLVAINIQKKAPKLGLSNADQWKVFSVKGQQGLIVIKNPFTAVGQRYWIRKLLESYTKYPNPNNLLPSRFNENIIKDFWTSLNEESDDQQKRLIKKSMRWSTLGYHYDWTNKIYNENRKNDFPQELSELVESFADVLGFENYHPEAAILNFYPIGSTLSAHTDHSEFYLESPLFSISFGQSAIFLIGGTEKEQEAIPILLSSGDVLVMSGESRLCYHAVPRVFCTNQEPWNSNEEIINSEELCREDVESCLRSDEWKIFDNYLKDSRINVNVRQVNK